MFVGATGVGRVVERTLELMREHDTDDVHPHGGINLDVLQKYLNFHYSVSLDLFGAETSTNAANYFAGGLKGRFQEERRDDDHVLRTSMRLVPEATDDGIGEREVTQLSALNETLRDDYREDCQKGLDRWNRALREAGADVELRVPHVGFHREVGTFSGRRVTPDGEMIADSEWAERVADWLPTDADKAHVTSLMVAVTEPGRMAGWIAPPSTGINQKPVEFEYVRV
jgi:benzoyl-CoA 2,3-dioxygenase component B